MYVEASNTWNSISTFFSFQHIAQIIKNPKQNELEGWNIVGTLLSMGTFNYYVITK